MLRRHLSANQFGYIEGLHQQLIIVRVTLRQQEGFAQFSLRTDVGEEGAGVESIQPTTAENDPAAVGRPAVVAVRVVAVPALQRNLLSLLQVDQAEIGVAMPDGEGSVGRPGAQQVTAIGRDAREEHRLLLRVYIIYCIYLRAETAPFRIEVDAAEVVMQAGYRIGHGSGRSRAEIERTTVGREGREGLERFVGGGQWRGQQLVCLPVIHDDVGLEVEHLHPLRRMEILCRLVHREGYVTAGRVPIGIDQRGEILELLRFQLDHLIAHGQIGSAPFRTHVQQHPVGILLAEGVAVDTVEIAHLVFVDRGLLKTAQIALVNAHPVPQCITRLDEPVGQVAVDRLGSHADRDRLVTLPALRILSQNRGLHLPSLGSLQERMPLLKRDVERSPIACHFQRLSASGQLQGKGL